MIGVGTWPLSRPRPPVPRSLRWRRTRTTCMSLPFLAHKNANRCKASHSAAMTLAGTAGTRMG